ncbi:MAG: argininosuccinate lyase [Armatimonadetes bacterium]|nr:argininosuccinate lyase [Armatimonadota bacterium]MDE2206958.1 argininosuccinate lyase [Armatimonadota bacterium]
MRKLWSGRIQGDQDALFLRLNNSLPIDCRLWREDIQASIAHAGMLGACGIIPSADATIIVEGLEAIRVDLESGDASLPKDAEDIHTAIEVMLGERVGAAAGRLHTARSRNDQVATDTRLFTRSAIDSTRAEIRALQLALLDIAAEHADTLLPGLTHLQHAQPCSLGHHMLAWFQMLTRDDDRLICARKRANVCPLGAAALAGTSFPIDRFRTATELEFDGPMANSIDAVSDRDYILDYLSAAATLMAHLSRMGEELVLWSSPEYGFVTLGDAVTTGSSIMPQKRNPDAAELVRGKSGRVFGDLMAMLTVVKGLPLAYNKDLQEDKELLFDAVDTLSLALPSVRIAVQSATFHPARMAAAMKGDASTATDLADALTRRGMPFREAHRLTGAAVSASEHAGLALENLTAAELRSLLPEGTQGVESLVAVLNASGSAASRTSYGGTSPEEVRKQLKVARADLERRG